MVVTTANFIAILLILLFWKVHMKHGWLGLIPNIIGTCAAVGSIDSLLQGDGGAFIGDAILSLIFYSLAPIGVKLWNKSHGRNTKFRD